MGDVDAEDVHLTAGVDRSSIMAAGMDDSLNDPDVQRLLNILARHQPDHSRRLAAGALEYLPQDSYDDAPDSDEAYRDRGSGGVPASATAIGNLERKEYDNNNLSEPRKKRRCCGGTGGEEAGATTAVVCPVCLADFFVGDDLVVMPCKHRFHFHESFLPVIYVLSAR